ncbi:MAG: YciI family protein [Patescibacteria group bacterium]
MRWVAIFDDREGAEAVRERYAEAHLAYLAKNRDRIRLAGGLRPAPDERCRGGLWVLEAVAREEAIVLIENDPFFVHGLRKSYRLLIWGKAPCYDRVVL